MGGASAKPQVSAASAPGRLMRRMGPELDDPPPKKPDACEPFVGPPQHPEKVSETMVDRWKGKHAKEGDQGKAASSIPMSRAPAKPSAPSAMAIRSRAAPC
jgi:hypothetical protein